MSLHIITNILDSGLPLCETSDCASKHRCANHHSAGDFRHEDGGTPNLTLKRNGTVTCDKTTKSNDGALIIKKMLVLVDEEITMSNDDLCHYENIPEPDIHFEPEVIREADLTRPDQHQILGESK